MGFWVFGEMCFVFLTPCRSVALIHGIVIPPYAVSGARDKLRVGGRKVRPINWQCPIDQVCFDNSVVHQVSRLDSRHYPSCQPDVWRTGCLVR